MMMKLVLALVAFVALAFMPAFVGPYPLGLGIGILGYGVLATAWAMFSGPTQAPEHDQRDARYSRPILRRRSCKPSYAVAAPRTDFGSFPTMV